MRAARPCAACRILLHLTRRPSAWKVFVVAYSTHKQGEPGRIWQTWTPRCLHNQTRAVWATWPWQSAYMLCSAQACNRAALRGLAEGGAAHIDGAKFAYRCSNGLQRFEVNNDTQKAIAPSSARRRLVRGAFSAPAVLTLYSGSALAAASLTCRSNAIADPQAAGATAPIPTQGNCR